MYMLNGGVYSGMPLWLAFGLVFPWFAMDGARCCVMFALDLIAALGCLAVQMFFPELILLPEGDLTKMAVLDVAQVMVTVPVMIGLTVKYQSVVFKRQQRKMEQQEKKLLEAMRTADRANEAKTSFLASMSHEIRTPINAVLGMDEMILRESSDESILSYAANIQSAGHSLLSVINDILDLSKLQAGVTEMNMTVFDLSERLSGVISRFDILKENDGIIIKLEAEDNIVINADITKLEQVVYNLINNAVTYTGDDNTVIVRLFRKEGGLIRFEVTDHGDGIAPEYLPYIWDRYYKVSERNKTHKRAKMGSGIGLSIVKKIMEDHGGKVWATSRLGIGTIMYFVLRKYQEVPAT